MPELPQDLLAVYGTELLRLLADKLKEVGATMTMELDDDFDKLSVCNNASWTIGEVAMRVPDLANPLLEEIINTFGQILSAEIL